MEDYIDDIVKMLNSADKDDKLLAVDLLARMNQSEIQDYLFPKFLRTCLFDVLVSNTLAIISYKLQGRIAEYNYGDEYKKISLLLDAYRHVTNN